MDHNYEPQGQDKSNGGCSNNRSSESHGPCTVPPPLKSNLKKATVEEHQLKNGRKVSWPDAHGKDLAHVQEFESSVLEEGELEGVNNSCICAIQ